MGSCKYLPHCWTWDCPQEMAALAHTSCLADLCSLSDLLASKHVCPLHTVLVLDRRQLCSRSSTGVCLFLYYGRQPLCFLHSSDRGSCKRQIIMYLFNEIKGNWKGDGTIGPLEHKLGQALTYSSPSRGMRGTQHLVSLLQPPFLISHTLS